LTTTTATRPTTRPADTRFSSGPCRKRPGWRVEALAGAVLGRSHRGGPGEARLGEAIARTRALLELPADHRLAIVPGSDTGAFEMAMWSLLGARGVDVLAWESFGHGWARDITDELRLDDVRVLKADYGALPDLGAVDPDRDTVFVWNGTTSGARLPDGDWIAADRAGLTLCDATSAAFAMPLPWDKLDVTTFSWQKALGGEAAHGMLALSPRAVDRLAAYRPPWPLPKLFRLVKNGKLDEGPFRGKTINTPSLLCVEDLLDALGWAERIGGLAALVARAEANLAVVADWVAGSDWTEFLTAAPAHRSPTAICLGLIDPRMRGLDDARQRAMVKAMIGLLDDEGVAHDIGAYRDAPPGLRLWGGPTVETADIAALPPWLDWAYGVVAPRMIEDKQ